MLDRKNPGVGCTLLKSFTIDKLCEVKLDHVVIEREGLLGNLGKGWSLLERTLQRAAIAKCAEMIGGAEQVLEMTLDWAKQRIAFDRPIGSFQAIQHLCSNMYIDLEGLRLLTYQSAWMIDQGKSCDKVIAMAKSWASRAYREIAARGMQIHGAIAFSREHSMQLYYKHAKSAELSFGDARFQRKIIAKAMDL